MKFENVYAWVSLWGEKDINIIWRSAHAKSGSYVGKLYGTEINEIDCINEYTDYAIKKIPHILLDIRH